MLVDFKGENHTERISQKTKRNCQKYCQEKFKNVHKWKKNAFSRDQFWREKKRPANSKLD